MNKKENSKLSSRRKFIGMAGAGIATMSIAPRIAFGATKHDMITGFDKVPEIQDTPKVWVPVSDRKIRVGLVGYGYSRFSAAFGFQDHPNVEVVAVSDIIPERCAALAKATRCKKERT